MTYTHTPHPRERAEYRLVRAYCDRGDPTARAGLVERNLPLVRSAARRYARDRDHLEELVQVGCIGLLKAIDRFDAERGVELQAYALPTIHGELRHYLRDQSSLVRFPHSVRELKSRLGRVSDDLAQRLGRLPSRGELATAAGVDEAAAAEALQAGTVVSLDSPGSEPPTAAAHADSAAEERTAIATALRTLDHVERRVVYRRFFEDLTQEEIAAELGLSQAQISRLLRRAIDKMRTHLAQ